jgi:hypothetical protein
VRDVGVQAADHAPQSEPRAGVAVGNFILDLKVLVEEGIFEDFCQYKFPFDTLTKVGESHLDVHTNTDICHWCCFLTNVV